MKQFFNRLSFTYVAFIALMAGLLCSCSSKRDKLLESVPSDVDFVAVADLMKLGKESGVTIEDGRLVFPRQLSFIKDNASPDGLKMLGRLAGAIDIENIVAFGSIKNEQLFVTAAITDVDELKSIIKKMDMNRSTEKGVTVYSSSESDYAECLALNEDETQIWFVGQRRDLSMIEDFEFARKKNNILRYSGLADVLKSDNIINAVIDPSSFNAGIDGYWFTLTSGIDNNAIVAQTKIMKPDGEEYESDVLKPIDTDFLRYMPANFIAAAAMGINQDSDWLHDVSKALESALGYQAKSQLDEVMPYLKALDGTIAIGVGPRDKQALYGSANPADWQAVFMAHLSQDKLNDLVNMANNLFPRARKVSNGLYSITTDGATMTYGAVDGYFAVGLGVDLKPDKNNSFANDFTGKPLAMVIQTPLLNSIVDAKSLDYSIKAALEVNGTSVRLQINLVGSDDPIIPTLISGCQRFYEEFDRKVNSMNRYSDYYEPVEVVEEVVEVDSVAADVVEY